MRYKCKIEYGDFLEVSKTRVGNYSFEINGEAKFIILDKKDIKKMIKQLKKHLEEK